MSESLFSKALVVEDEPLLASALLISLKKLGIDTLHVTTLEGATKALDEQRDQFDLILLDRMLPDGDGIELVGEIRRQNYTGVILMLTAIGTTQDRVRGLEEGADDYLPKPFSWEELGARLKALSRRRPIQPKTNQENSATWTLDLKTLSLKSKTATISLTSLEAKVMEKMMATPGEIVSREELLKDAWGFQWLPKTRTVDFCMSQIRKKIETDAENPRHIVTVRGAGYKWIP